MSERKPAIFLDRDGVLNYDREDYVKSWEEFHFIPGSLEALAHLAAFPTPLLVVTNQSIIGRGLVSLSTLEDIHRQMTDEIRRHGGRIDRIYYCPHAPWENCSCRKPRPGLLLRAAEELGLDLSASWFIGDRLSDLEAGQAAGVRTILVGERALEPGAPRPSHVVENLLEAVQWLEREVLPDLVRRVEEGGAPAAKS